VLVNLSRHAPLIKIRMERCVTPNATPVIMVLAPSAGHLVPQDTVTTVPSALNHPPMEEELVRSSRLTTLRSVLLFGTLNAVRVSALLDATSARHNALQAWLTLVFHAPRHLMVARLELPCNAERMRSTMQVFAILLARPAPLVLVLSAGATALQACLNAALSASHQTKAVQITLAVHSKMLWTS